MAISSGVPISLDAIALITVSEWMLQNGVNADSLLTDGLGIYHDGTGSPSTATVQVDGLTMTLTVDATPTAIDLSTSSKDTMGELETHINSLSGWYAVNQVHSESATANLRDTDGALNALLVANRQVLQIESLDAIILLINAASRLINEALRRIIAQQTYSEFLRSSIDSELFLTNYPIEQILRMSRGRQCILRVKNAASDAFSSMVRVDGTSTNQLKLQIVGGASAGTDNIDFSIDPTIDDVADAINALSAKGWSATVASGLNAGNAPSTWILPMGARECHNVFVDVDFPEEPSSWYEMDSPDNGIVRVNVPGSLYYAEWVGGYATIPQDIRWACGQLVKEMIDAGKRDTSLTSERLGDYAWTAASGEKQMAISDRIMQRIGHYKEEISAPL